MKRLIYILPTLAFVVLSIVLFYGLRHPSGEILPSALINKPAPKLTLPGLDDTTQGFGPSDLKGHVTVVNIWASWCVPCREEADALATLGGKKDFELYGLVYKDRAGAARAFLTDLGNPFVRVGLDANGRAGIEWGVYGVPETYVVDKHGIVRARFVGPLTTDTIAREVLPAIATAQNS